MDEKPNENIKSDNPQVAMIGTVGALYLHSIISYILCLLYADFLPCSSSADFPRQYLP
jgi:hypothetical protein